MKVGLVVGRMQPITKGHQRMFDTCFSMGCEKVVCVIGNCDEISKDNPFSFEVRKQLIKSIYEDKVICVPLYNSTKHKEFMKPIIFGKKLFDMCYNEVDKIPDLYVYGDESTREGWFDEETIKNTIMIKLNRGEFNYSGTKSRQDLLDDDYWSWRYNHDTKILKYRPMLKQILQMVIQK